jgi:hypothetical protein
MDMNVSAWHHVEEGLLSPELEKRRVTTLKAVGADKTPMTLKSERVFMAYLHVMDRTLH